MVVAARGPSLWQPNHYPRAIIVLSESPVCRAPILARTALTICRKPMPQLGSLYKVRGHLLRGRGPAVLRNGLLHPRTTVLISAYQRFSSGDKITSVISNLLR